LENFEKQHVIRHREIGVDLDSPASGRHWLSQLWVEVFFLDAYSGGIRAPIPERSGH
jgi:hypothetical protein